MKIATTRCGSAWNVRPLSGPFLGQCVARADGISLKNALVEEDEITGEVVAVWGLEVIEPMIFNDPRTIRGLGLGRAFDMREQAPFEVTEHGLIKPGTRARLASAKTLWVMGCEAQAFGERTLPAH